MLSLAEGQIVGISENYGSDAKPFPVEIQIKMDLDFIG